MAPLPPAPNVVILGVDSRACRWLRFNLDRHPDFFLPPLRTDFFLDEERMVRLGLRWHREQFHGWEGQPLLGEWSGTYLAMRNRPWDVIERLRKHLPDARYVLVLGDPFDAFRYETRRIIQRGGLPEDLDLDAFCRGQVLAETGLRIVADSILSPGTASLVGRFGDAVLPFVADEIETDPVGAYRRVVAHLGGDPAVVPEGLEHPRYRGVDDQVATLEGRQLVYAWYRYDVEQLGQLFDLDLSAWDPGLGPAPTTEDLISTLLNAAGATDGHEAR